MKLSHLGILILVTTAIPLTNVAFADEFLVPISSDEEQTLAQRNDYFLKKHGYIAKRQQIVRVDAGLLTEADSFRITFFEDAAITVRVKDVDIVHEGKAIRWTGEIIDPDLSAARLIDDGVDSDEAKVAAAELSKISIGAYQVALDQNQRRKYQIRSNRFDDIVKRRVAGSIDYDVSETFGVYFDELNPNRYSRFRLIPFDQEPGYHLLIEVDRDKIVPARPHSGIEDAENARKRIEYQQFLDSLGPDPNQAILQREERQ